MFDIGWTEMALLAVIILLVMGPRELPVMLRTLGRYVGNLRVMAFNFRRQIDLAALDATPLDTASGTDDQHTNKGDTPAPTDDQNP